MSGKQKLAENEHMRANLEVTVAQGKWFALPRLRRMAQRDQRKLSATELRVSAATEEKEPGPSVNRGRTKHKPKWGKRQREASAADTSSVRQPQARYPSTQCQWVLKAPVNKNTWIWGWGMF